MPTTQHTETSEDEFRGAIAMLTQLVAAHKGQQKLLLKTLTTKRRQLL